MAVRAAEVQVGGETATLLRFGQVALPPGAVIDGTVVDIATDGDEILTSDPDDIRALATVAGKRLLVTRVS